MISGSAVAVPYLLAVVWVGVNGDPNQPGSISFLKEPPFPNKQECEAAMIWYLGMVDAKRGKLECVRGVRQ